MPKKIPEELKSEMWELYANGSSVTEIAEKLSLTYSQVYPHTRLKENKI